MRCAIARHQSDASARPRPYSAVPNDASLIRKSMVSGQAEGTRRSAAEPGW
ncbi:hypothetical protein [Kibdelosporangium philippinense]|uniref:hypothetical protein n=1 Tax=Kibdelosporangium philippinense TaxID=211113 RepID=UPI0036091EA2